MSVSEEFWMSDKAAKNFAALEQQRDELLAALERITDESVCLKSEIVEQARAVIAKVKGAA